MKQPEQNQEPIQQQITVKYTKARVFFNLGFAGFCLGLAAHLLILRKGVKYPGTELIGQSKQQNELKDSGDLLNSEGHLNEYGWSINIPKKINSNLIVNSLGFKQLNRYMTKKWDKYIFTTNNFIVYIRLTDYGWSQYVTVLLFNKATNSLTKKHIKSNLVVLQDDSHNLLNQINIIQQGCRIMFDSEIINDYTNNLTQIYRNVSIQINPIYFKSIIQYTPQEDNTIQIVTPFSNNPEQFSYYYKVNGLLSKSLFKFQGVFHEEESISNYEFFRGNLPFKSTKLTLFGQAVLPNGDKLTLNLGRIYQDPQYSEIIVSDDIFQLNNASYKLDITHFQYSNISSQWKIYTEDENLVQYGSCNIVFNPIKNDNFGVNYLFSLNSYQIIFGKITGYVETNQLSEKIQFQNIIGFVEIGYQTW